MTRFNSPVLSRFTMVSSTVKTMISSFSKVIRALRNMVYSMML